MGGCFFLTFLYRDRDMKHLVPVLLSVPIHEAVAYSSLVVAPVTGSSVDSSSDPQQILSLR